MALKEHRLERRARLLAMKMQERVSDLQNVVGVAFRREVPRGKALAWWRKHRFDELGAQVLARMQPQDILDLDLALAQAIEAEQEMDDGFAG